MRRTKETEEVEKNHIICSIFPVFLYENEWQTAGIRKEKRTLRPMKNKFHSQKHSRQTNRTVFVWQNERKRMICSSSSSSTVQAPCHFSFVHPSHIHTMEMSEKITRANKAIESTCEIYGWNDKLLLFIKSKWQEISEWDSCCWFCYRCCYCCWNVFAYQR